MKEQDETIKLSLKVIKFKIIGVVTQYTENIWIDDKYHVAGGYYQPVKKTYEKPKVEINFIAGTDKDLEVGAIYTDGINNFLATTKNTIILNGTTVETFELPKELTCVFKDFKM